MKKPSHNSKFRHELLRNTNVRCLLASAAGCIVGCLVWGVPGWWLALAALALVWAEDWFDPFHRYRRAYYRIKVLEEYTGRLTGTWDECIVRIVHETPTFYRVRYPLLWTYERDKYIKKSSASLTMID